MPPWKSPTLETFFRQHQVYANLSLRPVDVRGWGGNPKVYARQIKEAAQRAPNRPLTIVEVGVWKGSSTLAFARCLQRFYNFTVVLSVRCGLYPTHRL